MTDKIQALTDFEFAIPLGDEVKELLEDLGYERRNGSCSYTYKWYVVRPLKLWYYPVESYSGIKLTTEEVVIVKHKLLVGK